MGKNETMRPKEEDETTRDLALHARAVLDAIPARTRLDQLHSLQRLLGVALHAAAGHPDTFGYYREVLPEGVVRVLLTLAQLAAPAEAKVKIAVARDASDVVDREAPTVRPPRGSGGSRTPSTPPHAHCIACSGETFCVTSTDDGARLSCVTCGSMYRFGDVTRVVTVPDRNA